ncbi:protein FAM47E isoform X2 [Denticeps clupeoides]|uniref:protein FAM47E isoform X2 n=1 Tax=Denticeps clupeoides TaxID=299321 RepID=UPI0010A2D312|nr:putative protein FAM47D isoform X2 [Denticeps clupeoides]
MSALVRTSTAVFPWYKERLLAKPNKDPNNREQLVVGRNWRFIKPGLDDFRGGSPTDAGKGMVTVVQFGDMSSGKPPAKRFSKRITCFSKQNPLRQERREHVDAVEQQLAQHPLALYPHLESGMPPEVFDQVLSVIEPDMFVKRESAVNSPEKTLPEGERPRADETEDSAVGFPIAEKSCSMNPFKWQQPTERNDKEQKTIMKQLHHPSQDKEIHQFTKLFCDWVLSLGGESNGLTESTLLEMFTSSYEKNNSQSIKPKNTQMLLHSSVDGEIQTCTILLNASAKHRPSEVSWCETSKKKFDLTTCKQRSCDDQDVPDVSEDVVASVLVKTKSWDSSTEVIHLHKWTQGSQVSHVSVI